MTTYIMKILSAQQIRSADLYTIDNEPISSVDLMERASAAFVDQLLTIYPAQKNFTVVCGPGNNGGDGLVVARLLYEQNKEVRVIFIKFTEHTSDDFQINEKRLSSLGVTIELVRDVDHFQIKDKSSIIIDAIFGTGLSRPAEALPGAVISKINTLENKVIALDMPSGLFADANEENPMTHVINADVTISFQAPKLCFMLPETARFIGEWFVIDIGLSSTFIDSLPSNYSLFTRSNASVMIRSRDPFAHKGNFGHALLIAGSIGKIGAAVLSSRACLRTGVGLLTVNVPKCGYEIIQEAVPEAIAEPSMGIEYISGDIDASAYNSIGLGPGISKEKETESFISALLEKTTCPLVLDADGLNLLAKNQRWFEHLEGKTILTPHPKEFDRLFGPSESTFQRIQKQREASKKYNIIIVLKGHHTSVSNAEGAVYFNTTGNPGMATAGSGDVLTGIILALTCQGYSLFNAARLGVFLHGLAGDLALGKQSVETMIASDIIDALPGAFKELKN